MDAVRLANESGVREASGIQIVMDVVGESGPEAFGRIVAAVAEVASAMDDLKKEVGQ